MTRFDDTAWHCQLELKLRRTNGVAFQTFFSDVMQARHKDDFVRLKPQGRIGDKGCDGYLQTTGEVFACYGAQNGAAGSQAMLIAKINEDFAKAKADLPRIMTGWRWTHNMIEGMPVDALLAFEDLKESNPTIGFGLFGPPSIKAIFQEMNEGERIEFLGVNARHSDFLHLQISELKELVDAIIESVTANTVSDCKIEPVSPQKLAFNQIPTSWVQIIQSGRLNGAHVKRYFDDHYDALRGEHVANIFRNKYAELREEALSPASIMAELYAFVAGPEGVSIERQVAAYSLLAHLFESCDIFENVPEVELCK